MGSKALIVPTCGPYEQLDVEYDLEHRTVWYYLNPWSRPCFNPGVLGDLRRFQLWVEKTCGRGPTGDDGQPPVQFLVLGSRTPGVFNLGGDLSLFLQHIEARDARGLERYAEACIDVLYPNAVHLGIPTLTTVSLVQGDALGGGFEAALSSSILVAEEQARFGLPEILFNLIPGMGAYSFLSRKLDRARAERMILSGDIYTAAQLHEWGLVDVLAPKGEGEQATRAYLGKLSRRSNARQALASARTRMGEVTREELLDITRIWVNAAMNLDNKDLRTMRRLVEAQNRRIAAEEEASPALRVQA